MTSTACGGARLTPRPVKTRSLSKCSARSRESQGSEVTRLCLECHAPMAVMAARPVNESKLQPRGGSAAMQSQFDQSLEITKAGARPLLELGDVNVRVPSPRPTRRPQGGVLGVARHGPCLRPVSGVRFSETGPAPTPTTYSEWAAKPARRREARRVRAATCRWTEGKVVDPRVQRDSTAPSQPPRDAGRTFSAATAQGA